jgi:F1F0 ATPase subunit 2
MTPPLPPPLPIVAAALAGCALGLVHFGALWLAVRRHAARRGGAAALALHLGRLAVLGVGLWLIARHGALPLIAGLGGVVVARQFAVFAVRSGRC